MLRTVESSIDEVFITHELARRTPKKTDYLQEKLALQDLAARMADQPEEVLPRFVDLAMEMTGGVSAGLSLFEENPAPGVFRWQYLQGVLSPFNGATTPRNFSPCGITLDQNAPVLSLHPERVYDWISDANIVVPEVLLVPLYLGSQAPLGTLWIVSDKEGHFDSGHARAMTELASFVGIALRMLRSERQLQQALEEQATLTQEMSHRLKNMFAVTDGLIKLSLRSAGTKEDMAQSLSGRLRALASANALVRRNFDEVGSAPRISELGALMQAIVRPHENLGHKSTPRVHFDGPSVPCSDHAVNGIALVFHEFVTNAAKYGALKDDKGSININWRLEDDKLVLHWIESGGPCIEGPPTTTGFGSKLTQTTIIRQFNGTMEYDWRPAGLTTTFTIPLQKLSA